VRRAVLLLLGATVASVAPPAGAAGASAPFEAWPYLPVAERLMQQATNQTLGFRRLEYLCDTFGPRLSGTTNLEAALDWIIAELKRDGFDRVRTEPVLVPHWVRGEESLHLLEPHPRPLHALALGGSVATPAEGITAEVLVVKSFADLAAQAAEARGKIVLYDFPYTGYGSGLPYRSRGASEAAKVGAVASLIRSLTPFSMQTPHTGMMRYEAGVPRIPHAAVSVEDTLFIQRCHDRGQRVVVRLRLGAQTLPDAPSRNVIAEVTGREKPEQFVVLGGHTDSWDVGTGAIDDASGCLATWEAARLLRQLEPRPRRTVRLVLWVNEENGLRGARAYRTNHNDELPRHSLALEADLGVFRPEGFSFNGSAPARQMMQAITRLLERLGASRLEPGEGGADTSPLAQAGVPVSELLTQRERYFWFHHTVADTIDKLQPDEFNQCVAALAVVAYAVAELPELLPR
jgi:carboxypeptidase Q